MVEFVIGVIIGFLVAVHRPETSKGLTEFTQNDRSNP